MIKIMKKNSGFTLIELLIYMGIFSVLTIVLFQLLTAIFDVQLESESNSDVASDGNFLMNRFLYDISGADSVIDPQYFASPSSILSFVVGTETYTYSLDNGNLLLSSTPSGAQDRLNSFGTSVSNVSFVRYSDTKSIKGLIDFSFTLTSDTQNRSGSETENFNITAGIR